MLKSIPDNYILQVENSSAIRYTQLFNLNKTLNVYCNRGTSGLDGSTSTSVGCAVVSKKPTVFITGDLSLLYDSNAFWNNYIPNNYRVIVINNNDGTFTFQKLDWVDRSCGDSTDTNTDPSFVGKAIQNLTFYTKYSEIFAVFCIIVSLIIFTSVWINRIK